MTKGQLKTLRKNFNPLNYFLKRLQSQEHVKNKDVVEEIRINVESEIDRLISWEFENDGC